MPAQAQTYAINDLDVHFQCAIEDNYDTEQALVPTDVFAAESLSGNIYSGEDETITFVGDSGIDVPVLKKNATNGFDLTFLGATSGAAGTPDIMSKIIRMCGGDQTVSAGTSVVYVAGSKDNLDSMTAKMFEKVNDTKYLEYLTTGARGQLDYSYDNGGKGRFSVSNMLGSYHLPEVVNLAQVVDYGTQKTALPKDINFDTTHELSWNGNNLCCSSMQISNIFGWEHTFFNAPGCKGIRSKRVQPKITITARMPDFENAFNPYDEQDTTDGVKRRPFVFQHGITGTDEGQIVRFEGDGANEMQMVNVQKTTIGDEKAISFDLLCLTGLKYSRL